MTLIVGKSKRYLNWKNIGGEEAIKVINRENRSHRFEIVVGVNLQNPNPLIKKEKEKENKKNNDEEGGCEIWSEQYHQDPVDGVLTGSEVDGVVTAAAEVVEAGHVVELGLKKSENGGVIGERKVGGGGTEEVRGGGGGGRSGGMMVGRERH